LHVYRGIQTAIFSVYTYDLSDTDTGITQRNRWVLGTILYQI